MLVSRVPHVPESRTVLEYEEYSLPHDKPARESNEAKGPKGDKVQAVPCRGPEAVEGP